MKVPDVKPYLAIIALLGVIVSPIAFGVRLIDGQETAQKKAEERHVSTQASIQKVAVRILAAETRLTEIDLQILQLRNDVEANSAELVRREGVIENMNETKEIVIRHGVILESLRADTKTILRRLESD